MQPPLCFLGTLALGALNHCVRTSGSWRHRRTLSSHPKRVQSLTHLVQAPKIWKRKPPHNFSPHHWNPSTLAPAIAEWKQVILSAWIPTTGNLWTQWHKVWSCCHTAINNMCEFPVVAVMNCHKFGGIQQKHVLSQFWRLEVQDWYNWADRYHGVSWWLLPLCGMWLYHANLQGQYPQIFLGSFSSFSYVCVCVCVCVVGSRFPSASLALRTHMNN
jgi:hypothetical protein